MGERGDDWDEWRREIEGATWDWILGTTVDPKESHVTTLGRAVGTTPLGHSVLLWVKAPTDGGPVEAYAVVTEAGGSVVQLPGDLAMRCAELAGVLRGSR